MQPQFWHKQTTEQPLFPNLIWSRPELKTSAGKLLIIGGHQHDFASVARAHQLTYAAGAGIVLSVMPEAVRKYIGGLAECDFFTANTSGGFAKQALSELLRSASWSDMTLLVGDNGRNSETAVVFEQLLDKSPIPMTICRDTIELLEATAPKLIQRPNTTIVASFSQLQRLCTQAKLPLALTFSMNIMQCVDALHQLSTSTQAAYITELHGQYLVAYKGDVSTTPCATPNEWRLDTAVKAAVWRAQNPSVVFEALTTAVSPTIDKQ